VIDRREQVRLLSLGAGILLLVAAAVLIGLRGGNRPAATGTPAASHPASPSASPSPAGPTLRSLAAAHHLRIGSAANTSALQSDPAYRTVLQREFSSVTPEDAMKWAQVEPEPGSPDWTAADRIVALAQHNGQAVYGHALVWHTAVPQWLTTGGFAPTDLAALLRRHIQDEVSRYRGMVWAWDVVNEPLDASGKLQDSLWSRNLGAGYIADAFRWAHAADPDAELFLNEFGTESVNAKSNALFNLVSQLRTQGVPIGGVGFQLHWTTNPLPADFTANLRRFAALGVDVAITEADVRIALPATLTKLTAQASVYRQAIGACLAVPRCVSFTVWGFSDRYSWIPNLQPGSGAACLFDSEFHPKGAYAAVAETLAK
jgi:endo-1,4-beta-xylanase